MGGAGVGHNVAGFNALLRAGAVLVHEAGGCFGPTARGLSPLRVRPVADLLRRHVRSDGLLGDDLAAGEPDRDGRIGADWSVGRSGFFRQHSWHGAGRRRDRVVAVALAWSGADSGPGHRIERRDCRARAGPEQAHVETVVRSFCPGRLRGLRDWRGRPVRRHVAAGFHDGTLARRTPVQSADVPVGHQRYEARLLSRRCGLDRLRGPQRGRRQGTAFIARQWQAGGQHHDGCPDPTFAGPHPDVPAFGRKAGVGRRAGKRNDRRGGDAAPGGRTVGCGGNIT